MSGFVSAKCNITRHEIALWILEYGQNQALHSGNIALLDLNDALGSLQQNCSAISSVMISDSSPNLSRVERLWGTSQCSKPGLWCNVSQKRQGEVQAQIPRGQYETDLSGQVWSQPVVSRRGASASVRKKRAERWCRREFGGRFQISFLPSIKSTNSRGSQGSLKRWRWASRCSWWTCRRSQAT